jgi:quercetin dioxygenase-like cupin family protein
MTTPDQPFIIHLSDVPSIARGEGVSTRPLVGKWNTLAAHLTTGVTAFAPGTVIPLHTHNVEETVMLLEGEATAVIDGTPYQLVAGDVTWVPAGVPHHFLNRGQGPMRIYWVYDGRDVLRTLVETGETFEHLSEQDLRLVTKPSDQ